MADQNIKTLVAQGLQALRAGGDVAKKATADIERDAKHPELKAALQTGNHTAETWAQRIGRAADEAGSAENVGNPILEAHFEVSRTIRQKATDDQSRDLGIVAAGQLALHYWIASFGTLGNYAKHAGLNQAHQDMQTCLEEARQADLQHTALAEKLLAG